MDDQQRQEAVDAHIAWCRDERASAVDMLARVDAGWTFQASHGDEPLLDITAERVAHWRQIIERMDAIIAAYGRRVADSK
jgi:hypothetical protein